MSASCRELPKPLPGSAVPGSLCVLVTNQSAIGRGMITEDRLHEIHAEMNRQLAEQGAALDAIYFCPDVPPETTEPSWKTRTASRAPACCSRRQPTSVWTLAAHGWSAT